MSYDHVSHTSHNNSDDETETHDDWNPNETQFKAFLTKDYNQAQNNVRLALVGSRAPMSVKDIKESCLHSADVIERVLASKVASGYVKQENGRYSWANKL